MRSFSEKNCTGNENTHFVFNNFCKKKNQCRSWDHVEKFCIVGRATDDNMAHAYCMLYTYGYKHTLRICNTYCFSKATMVAWKHLIVAQYAHCPSCLEWPLLPTHYRCRGLLLHLKGLNDTHSAGLPNTMDRLGAETSTWQHTTFTVDKHTCHGWAPNSQCQQACGHKTTP